MAHSLLMESTRQKDFENVKEDVDETSRRSYIYNSERNFADL